MNLGAEQFKELEKAFAFVEDAMERLLGEYALFVLEHEEVVTFLQDYLQSLSYAFACALESSDYRRAKRALKEAQLLFGEAQLRVNRSVISFPAQTGDVTLSKSDI